MVFSKNNEGSELFPENKAIRALLETETVPKQETASEQEFNRARQKAQEWLKFAIGYAMDYGPEDPIQRGVMLSSITRLSKIEKKGICIYVSGPMTGYPETNYPAFFDAEKILNDAGFGAVNPARLGQVLGWTWEQYMRRALMQMMQCSVVVALPGWDYSRGAAEEVRIANMLKMPVLDYEALKEALACAGH